MEFILLFLIILINSIALTIKLKNRIEVNIPISIIGLILIVYIFGLFDKLLLGVRVIEILTILVSVYALYTIIKNKKEINFKEQILTPGLFVYMFLYTGFIIFNKGMLFKEYDDFSHWGLVVKHMFNFGNFGANSESVLQYNEYPPFIGIFQYIILMLKNAYAEDAVITGLNILYISFIIPMFKYIKWDKSILKLLIYIPIVVFVPIFFYEKFYVNLFMDGFMGCVFAYIIFSWYLNEDKNNERDLSVSLRIKCYSLNEINRNCIGSSSNNNIYN